MDWENWIPAISVVTLIGIVGYLSRNLILTRLTKSVQHEYDKKLEELRAELRKNEELFKADIRTKDAQIEALRNSALSGLTGRQAVLYKRQIEAVEELWLAVKALAPLKLVSAGMAAIKFEEALKDANSNPGIQKVAEVLRGRFDVNSIAEISSAHKARPFVSQIAWAYYSAYSSILWFAYTKNEMIRNATGNADLLKHGRISNLVKVALPHQAAYIEKFGDSACHYLLDELEDKLLEELQNILRGTESDKETIKRAGEIIKASDELAKDSPAPKTS